MGLQDWMNKIEELEAKRKRESERLREEKEILLREQEIRSVLKARTARILKAFMETNECQQMQKLLRLLEGADICIYEASAPTLYFFSGFGIRRVISTSAAIVLPRPRHKSSFCFGNPNVITPEEFVDQLRDSDYRDPEQFCEVLFQKIRNELDELIK